ncbi:GNAT family N-acyltransferase [Bowmanella yangjiangensis]|uniref:L-ornithine N(alpha)-acyltransferase n=1 Tax=Bowmanella yangjiangensis TaxID=2811230 RepID=A0ABS3CY65_9ALTE|nr:lysophospholipid acyltransferase family protein [Bowmanella yangjiangensis]MBN7822057.1 lysophospholipid acyltransferase family protein [Bowmanella yangjiangensis]
MFTVDEVLQKHYPKLSTNPLVFNSAKFVLRRLLHEREFQEFARDYPYLQGLEFVEQVLEYFNFSYSVRDSEKERIPTQGRLVIIANHPIGTLDGLALVKLISEVRKDIKIVANEMLMAVEPLHPMLLPVNNMNGGTAKECLANIQRHLADEGVVVIFPAGEVSRLRPQGVRDTRWRSGFLRIAASAKAPVLPIFIDGKNSPLFYGVSMLYKPLATLFLVAEMFKQRQKHLPMRVGEMIPFGSYQGQKISMRQQVKLFKKHLYRIGLDKEGIFPTQKAIALPEDRRELTKAMRKECELLGTTADGKDIYLYRYNGSSPILREIGRLREVAFRAVGEGSNKRRDIDQYDSHYYHLVLWDKEELEIVGAYRFGDAKHLTSAEHSPGLYSASLFDFGQDMDKYFEQGLELGRSFVQPKYWGKRSLDYLWYGIGAFLLRHPQYRYLFGPVSISGSLPAAAKDLLVYFYQLYFGGEVGIARSNRPYLIPQDLKDAFRGDDYKADFVQLKHLLANMGAAIPTLYKQYTEVCEPEGVKFLSFGVDPDFNDCVDGLVLVDITKLKANKRARYMASTTKENAA